MNADIPARECTAADVDDGLLHWMLSLSSSQRLDVLAEFVAFAEELRLGGREEESA